MIAEDERVVIDRGDVGDKEGNSRRGGLRVGADVVLRVGESIGGGGKDQGERCGTRGPSGSRGKGETLLRGILPGAARRGSRVRDITYRGGDVSGQRVEMRGRRGSRRKRGTIRVGVALGRDILGSRVSDSTDSHSCAR